jgi:SAM-dependent methyltransferase
VALPIAPLPAFTLAHKHTHHLSRYTMYYNILCWLEAEPRFGAVLDISGSEPWLARFDTARTRVTAVNYPATDIHDLSQFPADSFDWVMADQVMEHLRFPQQAMDQVYRVLKPVRAAPRPPHKCPSRRRVAADRADRAAARGRRGARAPDAAPRLRRVVRAARRLPQGGRAIMTSCAANPVHMFQDYWRFTMDAFKSLALRFDSMDMCGSWGNGAVNAARALAGQFSGEPGSMLQTAPNGSVVLDPLSLKLASQNEKDHAMTVWMIVRKPLQ